MRGLGAVLGADPQHMVSLLNNLVVWRLLAWPWPRLTLPIKVKVRRITIKPGSAEIRVAIKVFAWRAKIRLRIPLRSTWTIKTIK
jgi:hypothetical protein